MRRHTELEAVITPIVTGLEYTFEGLQYVPRGRQPLIRLFIDKEGGVNIDDCERVARQLNSVLGVEFPQYADYVLEVSSPGMDRILFTKAQFAKQIGKEVSIRMIAPIAGKRNFKGILEQLETDTLILNVEGTPVTLSFADIDEARVVPKW